MGGETTRVENRGETTRGETTRGGNVLGAKRLVTIPAMLLLYRRAPPAYLCMNIFKCVKGNVIHLYITWRLQSVFCCCFFTVNIV